MYTPTVADRVLGSAALRRRQAVGRAIARSMGRIELVGLDNVPARGPVVLAMNHRAFLDGPLIFGFVPRPVTFLVKAEAFTPGLAPLLTGAGQIPVVRHQVDRAPIRLALRVLRGGGVIGIFPEGERGDGLVHTAKPGVAYLALRSGACVVPVALHGTDVLTRNRAPHRPAVRLAFGTPIHVDQVDPDRPLNRRVVADEAERIRMAMAALVRSTTPESALGVAA